MILMSQLLGGLMVSMSLMANYPPEAFDKPTLILMLSFFIGAILGGQIYIGLK